MRSTKPTRRAGATLIEVLVAIFVMGIGMLALLVLFPIGVLTMAKAIQDDRTAHAAGSATAIAKVQLRPSLFDKWFTQADWDYAVKNQVFTPVTVDGPSNALFLDIVGGVRYKGSAFADWVGGQTNGIRRLFYPDPSNPANPINDPLRWQISPDDLVFEALDFNTSGTPVQLAPGVFERNSAYSWAYLIRRPTNGKPNVVELTVVVFHDRPLALNSLNQGGETVYNAGFTPSTNSVTLTWGGAGEPPTPPAVDVGGWILDTTPALDPNDPTKTKFIPSHARFYRVVSILQTTGNSVDLELEASIKGFPFNVTSGGTVAILEGIAEVFEKGPVQWQNP